MIAAAMQLIEPTRWRPQPWRNGAGTTHELVRWPGAEPFAVRISVADLTAPAPFSSFPGYQRWLVLLDGGPVTLALAGAPVVLAVPGDHVTFTGETEVAATAVVGASRDLNFMVRTGLAAGVEVVRGPSTEVVEGAAVAVFTIAGEVAVRSGQRTVALGRHGCVWATGAALTVAVPAGASSAVLVVPR